MKMNGLSFFRNEQRLYICILKHSKMTKSQKNTYWMLFFLSLALSVGVYFYVPSLVSLMVVPVVTTFTKALDLI